MEIVLEVGVCTDIGQRERNEDAYYDCLQRQKARRIPPGGLQERGYLFAIADGRGGTTGGEEASQIAVDTLDDFYIADEAVPLEEMIQKANRKIYELNQERNTRMATTLTVARIHNGMLYLAHCGDSRAYYFNPQFNPQGIQQISRDHNQAEYEIESGKLKREDLAQLPLEKYLQLFAPDRMLGDFPSIEVDSIAPFNSTPNKCQCLSTNPLSLSQGDYIILTTDGLMERFDKDEQKVAQHLSNTILPEKEAQDIATSLVSIAKCEGTYDNTTTLVIRVKYCQPKADGRSSAEMLH